MSSLKFSRNDFRAFDFKEGCERGDVVRKRQVDTVLPAEINECHPCEPPRKKRKKSKKGSKAPASSRVAPVPEPVMQQEEDFYALELRLNSKELSDLQ